MRREGWWVTPTTVVLLAAFALSTLLLVGILLAVLTTG